MRRWALPVCLLVLLAPAALADREVTDVEKQVDALLQPLVERDLISGSILIARGDRVELAKGYGPANREHDAPCTADTPFRLASVTKSFTAMAIMILEERGLLKVSDTLDKYLPDYPRGDRIQLHHLLTHTSGVVNYSALPDHYRVWAMPHELDEVIARFRDEPLRFEPGERFEYSNSGYVLLTAVIEKVSGTSYEEFLRESIFAPLGMNDTGTDSHTKIIPGRATGHYNFGDGIVQARHLHIEFTSGAGSLYSTVRDLYKWDRALYTEKLLPRAALERMFTPRDESYAYGWFVREEGDRRLIEHRGGINGFLTMIQRFVDDDVVVISLFNYVSTFARDVNRQLVAIALGEPHEAVLNPGGVKLDAEQVSAFPGRYRVGDAALEVTYENDRLWVTDPELEKSEAIAQSATRFWLPDSNAVIHFDRVEDGKAGRLVVLQGERIIPCPRIEPPPGDS